MEMDVKTLAEESKAFRLNPKTRSSVQDFLDTHPLPALCAALVSPLLDERQRDDVVMATKIVLDDHEVGTDVVNSEDGSFLIVQGVNVFQEDVRSLAAEQLAKLRRESLQTFEELFPTAVQCLDDESVAVASRGQAALKHFALLGEDVFRQGLNGRAGESLSALLEGKGQNGLMSLIRAVEAIVLVAEVSSAADAEISKAVQSLDLSLSSSDILIAMNAMELLSKIAHVHGGLELEVRLGVLQKLSGLLENVTASDKVGIDQRISAEGILKFVDKSSTTKHADSAEALKIFIPSIQRILQADRNSDLHSMQDLGIVAIGSFGSTAPGLHCLVESFPDALGLVARACLSPAAESKVTAMNSFSQLLGAPTSEEESRHVFKFLESAWTSSGPVEEHFTDLLKRPFPDLNLAALKIFEAMSARAWGVSNLASTAGFTEILCSMGSDTKLVTDAKVDVAFEIARNSQSREAFGDGRFTRISALSRYRTLGITPKRDAQVDIGTMQL
ncbi:hypothetical protein NDN08_001339 [Rhodosorus marinus]|uniref:26S proteasome non-ATPase regulatory subunit 5 n=1 Tax=Rhodosorus marinus TaxID=101924 RepID=A0AAV8UQI1_9RHOD|nr:hypothetical protein NDN08_001339 [Rhodosorus marinus]